MGTVVRRHRVHHKQGFDSITVLIYQVHEFLEVWD